MVRDPNEIAGVAGTKANFAAGLFVGGLTCRNQTHQISALGEVSHDGFIVRSRPVTSSTGQRIGPAEWATATARMRRGPHRHMMVTSLTAPAHSTSLGERHAQPKAPTRPSTTQTHNSWPTVLLWPCLVDTELSGLNDNHVYGQETRPRRVVEVGMLILLSVQWWEARRSLW